jgi:hypothetical protein
VVGFGFLSVVEPLEMCKVLAGITLIGFLTNTIWRIPDHAWWEGGGTKLRLNIDGDGERKDCLCRRISYTLACILKCNRFGFLTFNCNHIVLFLLFSL